MKPDYKNWIPKGMLFSLIAGTMLSLALLLVFGIFGIGVGGKLRVVLGVVFGIAFVVCAKYTQWCVYAYPDRREKSKSGSPAQGDLLLRQRHVNAVFYGERGGGTAAEYQIDGRKQKQCKDPAQRVWAL